MAENILDIKAGKIRAYFSHSYRPKDKQRNLFFWELFQESGFYFTVDRKPDYFISMNITYLEWLMRKSSCFIAVVPRRLEERPSNCSRYQVFENELAMRAQKPRLIFVENGLPQHLFRGADDEVCFFHPTRYADSKVEFQEKARKLVQKAYALAVATAQPIKDIAIMLDPIEPYSSKVIQSICETIAECNFPPCKEVVNPFQRFSSASAFAQDVGQYEVLVSEVRSPYVPLDVFATVQERGLVPIVRICHLDEGETAEQVMHEMHLPLECRERNWETTIKCKSPMVMSGYKLDEGMDPVIFWHSDEIGKLLAGIAEQLQKITASFAEAPEELLTLTQARQYFLETGRKDVKVFISNANTQNDLATQLSNKLREEGIDRFHYKELEAIPIGTRDWLQKVFEEIDKSQVFLILMDEAYLKSTWCRKELEHARERFRDGKMVIYSYVVKDMEWPTQELGRLEGAFVFNFTDEQKIEIMLRHLIHYLEPLDEVESMEDAVATQAHELSLAEPYLVEPTEPVFEVKIVYNHKRSKIGTFSGIKDAGLVDAKTWQIQIKYDLLDQLRKAGARYGNWPAPVTAIGEELYREIWQTQSEIREQYDLAFDSAGMQSRRVHFRFATDPEGATIPFEWMLTSENGQPLCLGHRASRFMTGATGPRAGLGSVSQAEMRVLLVASNTGNIPQVDMEVDDLRVIIADGLRVLPENICTLPTSEATYDRVRREITEGHYQMLHFAGHGGRDKDGIPYLALKNAGSDEPMNIQPSILKEWVEKSDLRFVYLSTCWGGDVATAADDVSARFRYLTIKGETQAVIEARVPEVISFHWPIPDMESRKMAVVFYRHFLKDFDAARALYECRRRFADKGEQIWAAPILTRQY